MATPTSPLYEDYVKKNQKALTKKGNQANVAAPGKYGFAPGDSGLIAPPDQNAPTMDKLDVEGNIAKYKGTLDRPDLIEYESAADKFAARGGPESITGLGADYFDRGAESSREALLDQYFGDFGRLDQTMAGEGAAGRLGSGVARRMVQAGVTKPFAMAAAEIENKKLQLMAEDEARVSQFNAEQKNQYNQTMAQLMQSDSSNKVIADKANADIEKEITTMELGIAKAQTEADIAYWNNKLEVFNASWDTWYKQKQIGLEELGVILPEEEEEEKRYQHAKQGLGTQTSSVNPRADRAGGLYDYT